MGIHSKHTICRMAIIWLGWKLWFPEMYFSTLPKILDLNTERISAFSIFMSIEAVWGPAMPNGCQRVAVSGFQLLQPGNVTVAQVLQIHWRFWAVSFRCWKSDREAHSCEHVVQSYVSSVGGSLWTRRFQRFSVDRHLKSIGALVSVAIPAWFWHFRCWHVMFGFKFETLQ